MRWINKRAIPIAGVSALVLALAACSSGKSSGTAGASNTAGASATSAASAAGNSGEGGKTVRFYLSGDVNIENLWKNTIIPGFEKAFPGYSVDVTFSEHGVNDTSTFTRIVAAVKGGNDPGFDMIEAGFALSLTQADLGQPVTTNEVPNLSKVSSQLLDQAKGQGVPYRGSSVVLAYDSTKVSDPPKTLSDLIAWIKAHPGKFTYNSPNTGGSGQAFVQTVLDANMPSDVTEKMYNDTNYDPKLESNWDAGWKVLKGLTPYIYQHVYPNGNQAVLNLLGKGQIWMAPVWSDQALSGLASGTLPKTIKLTQISNPSFTGSPVYLVIPKTAKNKDAVYKLENYVLQPDVQASIVESIKGYPGIESQYLPSSAASLFEGLNTSKLRPTYSQKFSNDMKQQWQQKVA